jgi:hypothetical protein
MDSGLPITYGIQDTVPLVLNQRYGKFPILGPSISEMRQMMQSIDAMPTEIAKY